MVADPFILFSIVFLAQIAALSLILSIFFHQGIKEIKILFHNDLPHIMSWLIDKKIGPEITKEIGKEAGKQVYFQDLSKKGVEAKKENKKLGEADDELAEIVGPELSAMIGLIPEGARAGLVEGIKGNPGLVKAAISMMKKDPQQGMDMLMGGGQQQGQNKNQGFEFQD